MDDPQPKTVEIAGRPRPAARGEDPRRALGRLGEQLAAAHLERLGLVPLARNERTRHGEIDLVFFDELERTIVFVEVKTRRAGGSRAPAANPLEALRPRKRARLRRLACAWLADGTRPRPSAGAIRFDAVGVLVDQGGALVRLDHFEGAW